MVRTIAFAALFAIAPLAPAAAVVAIDAPARPTMVVNAEPESAPAVEAGVLGFTYGELAAAVAGLVVVGLAVVGGRQPHSVTA